MGKVRFRYMVKITFLDSNVVPIYVDPGTHLTQQNQDVPHDQCLEPKAFDG